MPRAIPLLIIMVLLGGEAAAVRIDLTYVGDEIPGRILIGTRYILERSDTLTLSGRRLRLGSDYSFDHKIGYIELADIPRTSVDTLRVIYQPLPGWLSEWYGRSVPDMTPPRIGLIPIPRSAVSIPERSSSGDISISGAKSFRFSTQAVGSSSFNQSIDLNISGELSPGVVVSGSVSDRGYNPTYGTANSRLSELDRINLKLSSPAVAAQVGDISVVNRLGTTTSASKRVSGAAVTVETNRFHVDAVAARPKGRYETVRFFGLDGLQGPYQIGDGPFAGPIVPGSETVWIDGRKLERGWHKGYTIDYPVGRITFSVRHPIDSRSRIEVDYEPQAGNYRGELFVGGGGYKFEDSSFYYAVEWLREGDDKNQPVLGELSSADRALLASAGDDQFGAVRYGAVADSGGAYVFDSTFLPDTVWLFVGEGVGDFNVQFSYVGDNRGKYRFLGTGKYQFVGIDSGNYLPISYLRPPTRTDFYYSRIGFKNRLIGDWEFDLRQSVYDKNLFSGIDDNDNEGAFYSVSGRRGFRMKGREGWLSVHSRRKEATYNSRERLYQPDFRRNFMLPEAAALSSAPIGFASDETLHQVTAQLSPTGFLIVKPVFSRLEYRNKFSSDVYGFFAEMIPHRKLKVDLGWNSIDALLRKSGISKKGEADNYTMSTRYRLTSVVVLESVVERDRREHDYTDIRTGTRYDRYRTAINIGSEQLEFEQYLEDSLTTGWRRELKRSRLGVTSRRQVGRLSIQLNLVRQWLERSQEDEQNSLGLLNLRYTDSRGRLSVSGSYSLSDETRNARGVSYLEVEPGAGNFIFEDSQFVPDPGGDYIRVEELLSERSKVQRGEKSFHFFRDWTSVQVRFNSTIDEELLPTGQRNLWWGLPFYSDESQPYLFYRRRYDTDIRLIKITNGHAINIAYTEDRELRNLTGLRRSRLEQNGSLTLRQVFGQTFTEEHMQLFLFDRDSYFSGAGEIDGYRLDFRLRQLLGSGEVSLGTAIRRANSKEGEQSSQTSLLVGSRLRIISKGEVRSTVELYRQSLSVTGGLPSYILTDNKPGQRGAVWEVSLNYGARSGLRLNLSVSGRHSDDRVARIRGSSEVIATF